MKIAVIQRFLPSRSRGGVGYFTHGLANALAARGHEVTVISQDPLPDGARYDVHQVPMASRGIRRVLAPLIFPFQLRHIDFSGYDVIHAQGDEQWLPRKNLPPCVRTLHGSALAEAYYNGILRFSPKHFFMHLYFYICEWIAHRHADFVVADAENARPFYTRIDEFIPNGVDLNTFGALHFAKTKHPTLLFVGELDTRKRGRLLLKHFEDTVRPSFPDAELWMVCPESVETLGVVTYHHLEDAELAKLYAQAWVFCLPSSYEGFGRPYVEAMASGTAVVATPNPGACEILREGRDGVIAAEGKIGSAIVDLMGDSEKREKYAALGKQRAEAFSWKSVAERYEAVYQRLVRRG